MGGEELGGAYPLGNASWKSRGRAAACGLSHALPNHRRKKKWFFYYSCQNRGWFGSAIRITKKKSEVSIKPHYSRYLQNNPYDVAYFFFCLGDLQEKDALLHVRSVYLGLTWAIKLLLSNDLAWGSTLHSSN